MKKILKQVSLATALSLGLSVSALAENCELTISGNDQLQFDKSELVVDASCDKVTLTLEHIGRLPKAQMGHNWVLTKTADYQPVAQVGQSAGLDQGYLPADDERIIAHTDLIGGGESTSVTFDVSELEAGGDYSYFCSFPGHWVIMEGQLIIK